MAIRRITYSSPLDALVRSLSTYEKLGDSKDFIEWAGDYQHYVDLKRKIEQKLSTIA